MNTVCIHLNNVKICMFFSLMNNVVIMKLLNRNRNISFSTYDGCIFGYLLHLLPNITKYICCKIHHVLPQNVSFNLKYIIQLKPKKMSVNLMKYFYPVYVKCGQFRFPHMNPSKFETIIHMNSCAFNVLKILYCPNNLEIYPRPSVINSINYLTHPNIVSSITVNRPQNMPHDLIW